MDINPTILIACGLAIPWLRWLLEELQRAMRRAGKREAVAPLKMRLYAGVSILIVALIAAYASSDVLRDGSMSAEDAGIISQAAVAAAAAWCGTHLFHGRQKRL